VPGKATVGFVARGIGVVALEETTFESWDRRHRAFPLVYAAPSWHWVLATKHYELLTAALATHGWAAIFWNVPRPWTGALGTANDATYERWVSKLTSSMRSWHADAVAAEFGVSGAFGPVEKHVVTWRQHDTREQDVRLLGAHSDRRMLNDDVRRTLHAAVGDVIEAHGGAVEVIYDTTLFLARRET
jgi:hypothetical protein